MTARTASGDATARPIRYHVTVGDRTVEVEIEAGAATVEHADVRVNGRRVEARCIPFEGTPRFRLSIGVRSHRLVARRTDRGRWRLVVDGHPGFVAVESERERVIAAMAGRTGATGGPEPVRAPMPGLVVKVEVEVGDRVEPGQGLVVVEAMKMENELAANAGATVRRIHVAEGDSVEKDAVLIEFHPGEGDGA